MSGAAQGEQQPFPLRRGARLAWVRGLAIAVLGVAAALAFAATRLPAASSPTAASACEGMPSLSAVQLDQAFHLCLTPPAAGEASKSISEEAARQDLLTAVPSDLPLGERSIRSDALGRLADERGAAGVARGGRMVWLFDISPAPPSDGLTVAWIDAVSGRFLGMMSASALASPSPSVTSVPTAAATSSPAPSTPSAAISTKSLIFSGAVSGTLEHVTVTCLPRGSHVNGVTVNGASITVNGTLSGKPQVLFIGGYNGEDGVYSVITGPAGGATGMIGAGYEVHGVYPAWAPGVIHADFTRGATLNVHLTSNDDPSAPGIDVRGTVTCG